jgi:hypothetical protein
MPPEVTTRRIVQNAFIFFVHISFIQDTPMIIAKIIAPILGQHQPCSATRYLVSIKKFPAAPFGTAGVVSCSGY